MVTIYFFIDLPFNEIGCYPASLRDGETKPGVKKKSGKRVKHGC